jgi:hypothetical protein
MINKTNFSLPYPALGLEGDFKEGHFSVLTNSYAQGDKLYIKEEEVEITNKYILELYNNGQLSTVYKIDCSSTFYNYCSSDNKNIEISLERLAKVVTVEVFLVASENIDHYHHATFNDDYFLGDNKGVFSLKAGDFVGFAGKMKIPLDENYTKAASLFGWSKRNESGSYPVLIDLQDKNIHITYPHIDGKYDIVNMLSNNYKFTFLNFFILPALHKAFSRINKEYEDAEDGNIDQFLEENRWANILIDGCQYIDHDPELDEPYTIAQNYLESILNKKNNDVSTPILEAFFKELSL